MLNKLLLADDSLTIQKVVELVLVHENFEIKAVNDGEQALEALASFTPDIVLADIEMPKVNGYQLCEKIKNNMTTVHIPVILLAGAFEPFDEEYAKTVGADDFIIKPFESQELISKVKALLVSAVPPQMSEPQMLQEMEQASTGEAEDALQGGAAAAGGPMEAGAPESKEPRWDDELPVIEEEAPAGETGTQESACDTGDEEYEAKVALAETARGFEEELSAAMAEESAAVSITASAEAAPPTGRAVAGTAGLPIEVPSKDDIAAMMREILESRVAAVLNSSMVPHLSAAFRDAADRALPGIASAIVEEVSRELVKDISAYLRNEITASVNRVVPEVAEAIIKKEIERITSAL